MIEIIKNIIISFQREIKDIEVFQRQLSIPLESGVFKAITIFGPRRAGKTFFLFSIAKEYIKTYNSVENIVYINFEDNRLISLTADKLDIITSAFGQLYPDIKPVLFLDEIQNINGWSKWVRKLVDQKFTVYVTGSNANLLSREIASELRGRTFSFLLLPLSFHEYLSHHAITLSDQNIYYTPARNKIHALLNKYLTHGGFPEVLKLKNFSTELLLQDYLQSIIYRDITERYKIRNTHVLKRMINFCLQNYASVFSVNKFYNDLKSQQIKISKDTLYEYMDYLEEAVFVFQLPKYSSSFMKTEKELKKIYLCDLGYTSLYSHKTDKGKRFENFIFLELYRIYGNDMFYYTEGAECDFVIGRQPKYLIQASYTLDRNASTFNRELRASVNTMEHFNLQELYLVTFDESEKIEMNNGTIHIMNYIEFLKKFIES